MRMGLIGGLVAGSAMALVAAGDASAQRVVMPGPGAGYHAPSMAMGAPMRVGTPMHGGGGTMMGHGGHGGGRWGSKVDGHWWAGANAPGGWRGYRRLQRGWALPGYWNQPGFYVSDWSDYGLGEPPAGYSWTRYYDDAVLVDGRGQVYDCVDGVNWDGAGAGYGDDSGAGNVQQTYGQSTYAPSGYAGRGDAGAGYAAPNGYVDDGYRAPAGYVERRNSGVGDAVIGGVAGGVAGNLIAGRGNRLAGTLIGAGVGGAAGYAIDRSQTHRVRHGRDGYDGPRDGEPGAGYAPPPGPAFAPPPPPPPPAGGTWHSPDGGTTITTTSMGGYAGGSTTVVTVQTAPVVTTTTTEIIEDNVTYSRHRPRRKWAPKPACGCC